MADSKDDAAAKAPPAQRKPQDITDERRALLDAAELDNAQRIHEGFRPVTETEE